MKLYKYRDYKHYRDVQIEANKRKIGSVWVKKKDIALISCYLKGSMLAHAAGLCHGTRSGNEQKWFREFLGDDISIIGTEISDTAKDFPDTIQWDFHNTKPEWIGAMDFVYSNSLDHAFDPEKCIQAWVSCLKPSGVCVLQWTHSHTNSCEMDPYGATLDEYKELVQDHTLVDVIEGSTEHPNNHILVISPRKET